MLDLGGRDILRADQFTVDEIHHILNTAGQFAEHLKNHDRLDTMAGRVLATLFYEPSTRTRLSFESAMLRLGGKVLSVASAMTTSSAAKGETLHDTGKMIESYADVAVIRHPREGSAEELAGGADIPVINGGDGTGQHPTQALLDLFTIRQERGTLTGLNVTLVGDLKNGRTVHSLAPVLALLGNHLTLVSPRSLAMPAYVTDALRKHDVRVVETEDLAEAAAESDVLYITRIQKERFENPADYEAVKGAYVVDLDLVKAARSGVILMHPLPRVDEIAAEVDSYEGAAYFRQAANGVPVRMALISLIAGAT